MTKSTHRRFWTLCVRLRPVAALALVVGFGFGIIATHPAQAQSFTDLYNFTDGSGGGNPYGGVLRDASGNLYSTAATGGSSSDGVVFKLDTKGTQTVLHTFTGKPDGAEPLAGLIRDKAGNFYGTTFTGGASDQGVVFKLSKSGTETVLYSFAGGTSDGAHPWGSLIQDAQGNFYGTTFGGGSSNWGVAFKLSKSGTETVLHSFTGGGSDGEFPLYTSLLMDKKGNLYGITSQGGTSNDGVVYKLSKSGKLTVLHSFTGGTTDGCFAYGTPAMDADGNLYGTTYKCGRSNDGIVWKLSARGKETVLHNFVDKPSDGAYPYAGVMMDEKGNLYGDTAYGGPGSCQLGCGTVYELNSKGTFTLLGSFDGSDGEYPVGGLVQDAKGNLYGTAYIGGADQYGTVWKLAK